MKKILVEATLTMLMKQLTQLLMYALILFVYSGTTIGSQSLIRVVDTLEFDGETLDSLEVTKTRRASTRTRLYHSLHIIEIFEHRAEPKFRSPERIWFANEPFAIYEVLLITSPPRAPPAPF